MLYLSRLVLNPRHRRVQRDLADCQQQHCTLLRLFGQAPASAAREHFGVLYRLDVVGDRVQLLLQSAEEPDWSNLPIGYVQSAPECKEVLSIYREIRDGAELVFRLRANPTRKVDTKTRDDGRRRHGRRLPLRDEEAQIKWLRRKADESGFELIGTHQSPSVPDLRRTIDGRDGGWRASHGSQTRTKVTFEAVTFEGRLRVVDAEEFVDTLTCGIGPSKAYGCGLLSVAPIRG